MIEVLSGFPDNVVAVACKGHVTRSDYENVLIPAVESTLKQHDKVRLYYEIGKDFEDIDASAVWEDIKVGFEHLTHWQRFAVVTDVHWIGRSIKAFGFMIPGEIRIFSTTEMQAARDWIVAD